MSGLALNGRAPRSLIGRRQDPQEGGRCRQEEEEERRAFTHNLSQEFNLKGSGQCLIKAGLFVGEVVDARRNRRFLGGCPLLEVPHQRVDRVVRPEQNVHAGVHRFVVEVSSWRRRVWRGVGHGP